MDCCRCDTITLHACISRLTDIHSPTSLRHTHCPRQRRSASPALSSHRTVTGTAYTPRPTTTTVAPPGTAPGTVGHATATPARAALQLGLQLLKKGMATRHPPSAAAAAAAAVAVTTPATGQRPLAIPHPAPAPAATTPAVAHTPLATAAGGTGRVLGTSNPRPPGGGGARRAFA